jgi:hypothetical protein
MSFVLLDVELFPSPSQNNILLDTFLSIKSQIEDLLTPLKGWIEGGNSKVVIVIIPYKISMYYLVTDIRLSEEMSKILNENLDLAGMAEKILDSKNN